MLLGPFEKVLLYRGSRFNFYSDQCWRQQKWYVKKSKIIHKSINLITNVFCLIGNESISVRHTVIEGARLGMHDSEELIERYRDDVKRTGVMLVKGIESVPSVLAMAFHYYCDEYNPIAKKSAVFSTFDLANCSHGRSI